MRTVLIAAAAVALLAAGAALAQTAMAQESFFNKRYCTIPGGAGSGSILDCAYNTMEQCRASASASTRYCAENPNWRPEPSAERTKARRRAG